MKIAVLMSTYNGEDYISEQIRSILNQTVSDFTLYIRDDGSTDSTVRIINTYSKKDSRIRLIQDDMQNLGPRDSFFRLLNVINADYYFFCDQDDVWKNNKIQIMIERLKDYKNDIPLLAYSNLKCIDKNGEKLQGFSSFENMVNTDIKNIDYFQTNNIPGCTMVINKKTADIFKMGGIKQQLNQEDIQMHDWWIALIAAVFGRIVHVNKTLVYYRQHSNNTLGAGVKRSKIQKIKNVFNMQKKIKLSLNEAIMQTKYFNEVYGKYVNNNMKTFIEKFSNYSSLSFVDKIKFIKKYKLQRYSKKSTLLFRIIFLF